MPVSPDMTLTHNKAKCSPLDLLKYGAKYIQIWIGESLVTVAAEAVVCGGASHCLRMGCAFSKAVAKDTKRRARQGHFVSVQPRRDFFAIHNRTVQREKSLDIHGRMQPVGLVYAECAADLRRVFKCSDADLPAANLLSSADPRTERARAFLQRKDAEAKKKTGDPDRQYYWERSPDLYASDGSGQAKKGRGRYFFVAPVWLDHSEFVCTYRTGKGPSANGYSDGTFARIH